MSRAATSVALPAPNGRMSLTPRCGHAWAFAGAADSIASKQAEAAMTASRGDFADCVTDHITGESAELG